MKILAIDTSCDETCAAVTDNTKVLSNIIWSQAASHAKFGGVMPSLAQRMHQERIGWVVDQAIKRSGITVANIDAVAVTVRPGLSIALGVGINKAKELAKKYAKRLIAVNHLEAHVLSSYANQISKIGYPAFGLVVSGGNTLLVLVNKIGEYTTLAQTTDDALGEALDKGARMLGLGYPGGAIMETFARDGNPNAYTLPVPIAGKEERKIFTFSGLKTAMNRLVQSEKPLTEEKIYNLAATFQNTAFTHTIRVLSYVFRHSDLKASDLLIGGGVSANMELRKRLRKLGRDFSLSVHFPYSKKLTGDNAAMIGVAAYFKAQRNEFIAVDTIDRNPDLKIDIATNKL